MNKKERFYKLLKENEFVLLDGGMGTMLQSSGLEAGEIPELLNLTHPEKIKECYWHSLYFLFQSVIPAGFEPTTHSLEGCCSIQLSYGTIT